MQHESILGDQIPRGNLEGWDFRDLLSQQDPIYPRVAKLDTNGKSWVDFTRSINAITLLGRGFGEIIEPVSSCVAWRTLRPGKSYLAACQADLEQIIDADGDPDSVPMRLTDNTIWYTPHGNIWECNCKGHAETEHSEVVQTLLPLGMHKSVSQQSFNPCVENHAGAFIFGFNEADPWVWGDTGPPCRRSVGLLSDGNSNSDSGIERSLYPSRSGESMKSSKSSPLSSTRFGTPKPGLTSVKSYSVGIICALALELFAVRALFDVTHDELPIPDGDNNYYSLGRIARHNIVAACLPDGEYGTSSAADVAANMLRSFPKIRFCLLVGIGGGVPSAKHDIRLGDVVVSKPSGQHSGVLPYDMRKALESGEFQLNGHLQVPPRHLLSAINNIRSDPHLSKTCPLQKYVDEIATFDREYVCPGEKHDEPLCWNVWPNTPRATGIK
ncbi:hypothetical protein BDV59DRAFT_154485 [Aspergillus ambiguus]|uniref:uncharacterized protein n=1 Tax=Aspergillus ambiguus TaxID=176160 RepID=UPI003CCC9C34